ncbi:MAG TPA: 23S rRNA (adenine(2503)-C(2))-methyltransferase RlmN [Acidobacteriota bacterium]
MTPDAAEQNNLIGMTRPEMVELLSRRGEPAYRGRQLYHSIYARKILNFEQMTDFPRPLRVLLAQNFRLELPRLHCEQKSKDGTIKLLLELEDGERIETVFIPETRRETLCISSQVGCAVGCTFCATATLGLRRNMTAGEIAGQPLHAQASGVIRDQSFNIVLMGMGEPLHNFTQVMRALEILCDPEGMAISPRRITVSTSGVVSGLRKLARQPIIPNLAISLNASNDSVRSEIMPINRKWNIEALLQACREFPLDSRRRITFEYVLLAGVNDSLEDARALAKLLSGMRAKVNLIAWNYNPALGYQTPAGQNVERFQKALESKGVSAFVRKPRGVDIFAACGQLALQSVPAAEPQTTRS